MPEQTIHAIAAVITVLALPCVLIIGLIGEM